jgi:hypothetical protein
MEVTEGGHPHENDRNPTWFLPENTRKILAKGREVKYAKEIQSVVDRALEFITTPKPEIRVKRVGDDLFPSVLP